LITIDDLHAMFDNIARKTKWNMQGDMLWGYFFTDQDEQRLESCASVLAGQGYRLVDIYATDVEQDGVDQEPTIVLHVAPRAQSRVLSTRRATGTGVLRWNGRRAGTVLTLNRATSSQPPRTGVAEVSEKWDFYFTNVNDATASIFVDMGIRDCVPVQDRPWLLWVWVYFQKPRPDGLSSNEEADTLFSIEDALKATITESAGADLVGRITTSGRREFYFYGPTELGLDAAWAKLKSAFPTYEFDSGTQFDESWSQYLNVLYPGPEDRQRIANLHVIESLQKHGDSLQQARPVSHWAYSRTEYERQEFTERARALGFIPINEHAGESHEELPFGVTLERVDRVDWPSINEVTIQLFRMANDSSGEYDGGETSVEKDG
jgi:hypothetical protein